MRKTKRLLGLVLACLLMLSTCFSAGALSYGNKSTLSGNGQYDSNWLYWSQGASEYESMRKYGCYLVAASKLMAESGTKSSSSFDPDDLYTWSCDHDYLNAKRQVTNLKKILENYAGSKFSVLDSGYKSSAMSYTSVNTKVMNYLNDGYYVIVQKPGHFMYVAREKSVNAGKVIISNSQSDIYNSAKGNGFKKGTDFAARLCKPLEDRTDKDKIRRIIAVKPTSAVTSPSDKATVVIPDCNGNHTKGEYLFREAVHPHKVYWTCVRCGEKFTDGSTLPLDSCEICYPPTSAANCDGDHTKGEYLFCEAVHPHKVYWKCAVCGERFTDGTTKMLDTCNICSGGAHTKGEYQFCEALHPHYEYWKCADCGKVFTDGSTRSLDSCKICNP